jgi:sec-independent protein translocase protein TatA
MGSLSPWHWLIVILVFVLLFGSKRLPDAARSLGKSMRIFKTEVKEMQNDKTEAAQITVAQPPVVAPVSPIEAQVVQPVVAQPVQPNPTDIRPA